MCFLRNSFHSLKEDSRVQALKIAIRVKPEFPFLNGRFKRVQGVVGLGWKVGFVSTPPFVMGEASSPRFPFLKGRFKRLHQTLARYNSTYVFPFLKGRFKSRRASIPSDFVIIAYPPKTQQLKGKNR